MKRLIRTAWVLGCILVASYAGARIWSGHAEQVALRAFQVERLAEPPGPETGAAGRPLIAKRGQAAAEYPRPVSSDVPTAVLRIQALQLEVPVYEGATAWNLNRGAARIEWTAPFGAGSNTGVAGHRDSYFRALRQLQLGDEIEVETLHHRLRYEVTRIQIVPPQAVEVLDPTRVPTLTLVTCYPFHHVGPAPQRWIAHAEQVGRTRVAMQ